ncbi:MAG TPA: SIMPL domain-containing protein [Novosphingobium sp.]|nr:SIMPL domain-containing protein [Novosphingobium sp.]
MQPRILSALAAISLISAPAALHAAKPAEVELHIEASASVQPDRAEVPLTIRASDLSEAEALAALAETEQRLRKDLEREGIRPDQIKVQPGANGKDVAITSDDVTTACAAADAAADVAADAAAASDMDAPPAARKRSPAKRDAPQREACPNEYTAAKTLLVTVTGDMAVVDRLIVMGNESEYGFVRMRPVYSQSDPAAARAKARSEALAKAQAEGTAYADAMGYRVVRIVRVSNARPAMSMNDLIAFIAAAETRSGAMQPSWFAATVTESVAIDFVMVPK